MKYMGSKNRHAKELLPIILKDRGLDQWYVEPFVGGFNMIDKVLGKRIGSDSNEWVIALFHAIADGWSPPMSLTEREYFEIKNNKHEHPKELVGFVGIGCSYGGKWFGGYARGKSSSGIDRNYCLESRSNLLKQRKGIQGVVMRSCEYHQLEIPSNSIIYCDPPYSGTTKYAGGLDHVKFFEWVRTKASQGHRVYVSEYQAPTDFVCVWEKPVCNSLEKNTGSRSGVEKLFTPNS